MSRLVVKTELWADGLQQIIIPLQWRSADLMHWARLFDTMQTATGLAMLRVLRGIPDDEVRRLACVTGYSVDAVCDLLLGGNVELCERLQGVRQ